MDEALGGETAFFVTNPAEAIATLARVFVNDQRQLALTRQLRQSLDNLAASIPADAVAEAQERIDALTAQWDEKAPHLAASFRLALEVLDTYGPEGVRVEDPLDAAIWNTSTSCGCENSVAHLRTSCSRATGVVRDHDADRRCGAGIEKVTAETGPTPGDQVTGGSHGSLGPSLR